LAGRLYAHAAKSFWFSTNDKPLQHGSAAGRSKSRSHSLDARQLDKLPQAIRKTISFEWK
jgi:hypothetical protein